MAQLMHIIVRAQLKSAYFLHFYGAMTLLARYADRRAAEAGAPTDSGRVGAEGFDFRHALARLVAIAA